MWRNNDDPNRLWNGPFPFGQGVGRVDAITMIQSNFGGGNLELIARVGDRLQFFWRTSDPPFPWNGPFGLILPTIFLRATQRPDGRFIEVDGAGFSTNSNIEIAYDIFAGGAPTNHQTGNLQVGTSADGRFHAEVKVNLGGDIAGANVRAVDLAARGATEAAI